MDEISRPPPTNVWEAQVQGLLDNYAYLEARLSELEEKLQLSLSQAAKPSTKEPKIADPEPFKGDRLQLTNFLSQCQLKVGAQPARYPDEMTKILFAGSFLRGEAYSWFQPLLASSHLGVQPAEFESFKTFTDALNTIYGDPNLEITAERELRQLRQTSSVAQYIAEFQRIRQYVHHNEAALISQFYYGLRDNVKDRLANSPRPSTLVELMKSATSHDSRIHERILERKADSTRLQPTPRNSSTLSIPPTPSRTPSPAAPPTPRPVSSSATPQTSADGTVPMQLDNVRGYRSPLSPAERERRIRENLCHYCGSPGHKVADCPYKPKAPRSYAIMTRVPERAASPPGSVISLQVEDYPQSAMSTNEYTHE